MCYVTRVLIQYDKHVSEAKLITFFVLTAAHLQDITSEHMTQE